MDAMYSRVDITESLVRKYQKELRPEVKTVCILQTDNAVWLEALSISLIASRDWPKETIERINLHFLSDEGEVPMFDPKDDIEANAARFVDELTPS